ncbi:acyl carrier protein [Paenibacillus cymbidii]|uniref:acyl carrier protein n=1 Tax=Paenibacillus cymbidii TaxID=1639034 RepID=UPI001436BFA2|nr:acyl carrier protein [Paenibacillus cymbidii]
MSEQLESQVYGILLEVLGIQEKLVQDANRDQVPSWDSLKHMELIFRLEEEFNIRFSMEQAAVMKTVKDISRVIEELKS